MSETFAKRRYLLNFDSRRLGQVFTDVLVIGGGVGGLRAAIAAGEESHVLLVTKDRLEECNTAYAQGGIAVVSDPSDSFAEHVRDTLAVGCGICHASLVEDMAREAPSCLKELVECGANFDIENGAVALGREGGHSKRRIVHASGDATGKELSRALVGRARSCDNIRIFESCFVVDLVVQEGRAIAALTHHAKYGHQIIWAKQIVLASGGAGCLYRETTNSPVATADGYAIALRAGAVLRDMEFMQFHPTALYIAGASRALISEAVRGEGAKLVDREGNRFMPEYHSDAELAPRDIVSRAMVQHMAKTHASALYLDVRHFPAGRFAERFPNIAQLCNDFDIDPATGLIPVRPAAHYMIGGVSVDANGRSSIDALWACGEAASTGIHGANRLASNSLLEGLVFGRRVGRLASQAAKAQPNGATPRTLDSSVAQSPRTELDLADVRNSLRALSWRNLGIDRTDERLHETIEIIEFWARYVLDKVLWDRNGWETQNMLTVARCMAEAARRREESRGVHYRSDHPESDDRLFLGHVTLRKSQSGIVSSFEPLTNG